MALEKAGRGAGSASHKHLQAETPASTDLTDAQLAKYGAYCDPQKIAQSRNIPLGKARTIAFESIRMSLGAPVGTTPQALAAGARVFRAEQISGQAHSKFGQSTGPPAPLATQGITTAGVAPSPPEGSFRVNPALSSNPPPITLASDVKVQPTADSVPVDGTRWFDLEPGIARDTEKLSAAGAALKEKLQAYQQHPSPAAKKEIEVMLKKAKALETSIESRSALSNQSETQYLEDKGYFQPIGNAQALTPEQAEGILKQNLQHLGFHDKELGSNGVLSDTVMAGACKALDSKGLVALPDGRLDLDPKADPERTSQKSREMIYDKSLELIFKGPEAQELKASLVAATMVAKDLLAPRDIAGFKTATWDDAKKTLNAGGKRLSEKIGANPHLAWDSPKLLTALKKVPDVAGREATEIPSLGDSAESQNGNPSSGSQTRHRKPIEQIGDVLGQILQYGL